MEIVPVAPRAPLVERWSHNPKVPSSILGGSKKPRSSFQSTRHAAGQFPFYFDGGPVSTNRYNV